MLTYKPRTNKRNIPLLLAGLLLCIAGLLVTGMDIVATATLKELIAAVIVGGLMYVTGIVLVVIS